jgi:hypothetical protein
MPWEAMDSGSNRRGIRNPAYKALVDLQKACADFTQKGRKLDGHFEGAGQWPTSSTLHGNLGPQP